MIVGSDTSRNGRFWRSGVVPATARVPVVPVVFAGSIPSFGSIAVELLCAEGWSFGWVSGMRREQQDRTLVLVVSLMWIEKEDTSLGVDENCNNGFMVETGVGLRCDP